jgi:hypothetical protein
MARAVIGHLARHGISVKAYFSLGFPCPGRSWRARDRAAASRDALVRMSRLAPAPCITVPWWTFW